jgi:hypothetical protein
VEAIAEAVEALEVEIDTHTPMPGVFDQPREIARSTRANNRTESGQALVQFAAEDH